MTLKRKKTFITKVGWRYIICLIMLFVHQEIVIMKVPPVIVKHS